VLAASKSQAAFNKTEPALARFFYLSQPVRCTQNAKATLGARPQADDLTLTGLKVCCSLFGYTLLTSSGAARKPKGCSNRADAVQCNLWYDSGPPAANHREKLNTLRNKGSMTTQSTLSIVHPSGLIYCAQTRRKGRGIFAAKRIKKGTLIEHAPILVTPAADWRHLKHTVINHYVFVWHEQTDEAGLVLGFGSLYNHSYQPNAYTELDKRHKAMKYIALHDIPAHEEITINYNGDENDQSELWFKVTS
jgi:uncharacterized protein